MIQEKLNGVSPELLKAIRQAALMIVDAIERELEIAPRTSEIRKQNKTIQPTPNDNVTGVNEYH